MQILIVRHGEPDYEHDSLTEKGFHEAELLADRLCELDIQDFYVSPLGRAQATAAPTLARLGRKAETLSWLTEFRGRIRLSGEGEVIPWNLPPQYWTRCPELYDVNRWNENERFRTGCYTEILKETCQGLDSLLLRYGYRRDGYLFHTEFNTDARIVLFCHQALGLTILALMLGISPVVMQHSFFMPTSSVTTLITEERVRGEIFFKCMQVGDTSHLYTAGEPVSSYGLFPEVYTV